MEGILIPQNIFVGDTAEFIFPLDSIANFDSSGLQNGYFQTGKVIQTEAMTVTSVQLKIRGKKEYISITFIPWETGDVSFPPLKEAGLTVKLPAVPVSSILEMSNTEILQPPRPPIIIPGTTYLLYITGFITALFFFAGIIIFQSIKKALFTYSFSRIQKKRIKFLMAALKKMKKKYEAKVKQKTQDSDIIFFKKEWLKELEDILRKYCFSIITESFIHKITQVQTLTCSEIILKLDEKFQNRNIISEFENVFFYLQALRFGNTDFLSEDLKKRELGLLHRSFNLIKLCEPEIQKIEAAHRTKVKGEEEEDDKF